MKKNINSGKERRQKVEFFLNLPDASEVILMGDFNQWNKKAHPMKKNKYGIWSKTIILFPGTYEYKFMADNEWINDPDNHLLCSNNFGTKNNFIVVSPK